MTERTKKRMVVHGGSIEHVLQGLERKYSMSKEDLPTDIGGTRDIQAKVWLEEREKKGL